MLHSLRFSNFFSFADETEVSFVLDARSNGTESSFASTATDRRLSKLLAVVGANGAGKTNLIKPLAFIGWFVSQSFFLGDNRTTTVQPHIMSNDQVSRFSLEFEIGGKLYRYTLRLTQQRVLFESLELKTSRLFSTLFTRQWDEVAGKEKIVQRGFSLPQKQAEKVKPLAALISTAAQYSVPVAQEIVTNLGRLWCNVGALGRQAFAGQRDIRAAAEFFAENEEHRKQMAALLRQWDFGLADVVLRQQRIISSDGREEDVLMPYGVHRAENVEMQLPMLMESSGTQAAFSLLTSLLPALTHGGYVVFDELESDLHPLMLEPILNLFISPKTNPHNAQLIFTCHSVEILNLLKKGQIMLVEKNERCRSEAWRLSDMEGVRADDNFYAKYMAGAYGAVPML
ncbi:ATP-binding protein [Uliginosibacterium sp. 31-16]|uniref:AAA family ATPase n=1 Tax=Uliginosibacterium sp. 31-16 TaxID=3068315 RepID=UPI00273F500B|nr:ATP-binding protein [Uliginosibacterium sp. 31-16]MDP5238204.1 ATP-binding protein [Uliginosibacterium sp. 31-16]